MNAAWDIIIVVRFGAFADIDAYRSHREHRGFVDEFLAPLTDMKKGWNFDCLDPGPGNKLEPE
jgi:hypothetical protein